MYYDAIGTEYRSKKQKVEGGQSHLELFRFDAESKQWQPTPPGQSGAKALTSNCLQTGSCHTSGSLMRVEGVGRAEDFLTDAPVVGGDSFEAFYRSHRTRLVGLAFAISGSRLGADDLVHDVLEAAYRDWDRLQERDDPAAWVRRMVVYRAVSAYRRRLSEAKAVARLALRLEPSTLPEPSADADRIWSEVRRLPRRQAQVVALRYVEQLTMTEIGNVLNCSKESVNTHLRRARETLSRRLRME